MGRCLQGVDSVGNVGVARVGVAGEDEGAEQGAGGERGGGQLEGRPKDKLSARKSDKEDKKEKV